VFEGVSVRRTCRPKSRILYLDAIKLVLVIRKDFALCVNGPTIGSFEYTPSDNYTSPFCAEIVY